MRAKLSARSIRPILVLLVLLAGALACTECGPSPNQPPAAEPTPTTVPEAPTPTSKPQITTIEGPEGLVLQLEGQALTEKADVILEVLPDGGLSTEGTPFGLIGPGLRVGFGEGEQIGGLVLEVPFSLLPGFDPSSDARRFAAWAMPDDGYPSLVGVLIDEQEKLVSLPIVGAGLYQLIQIERPVAAELMVFQPLAVPSYWQMSCGWCSTTAMTDVAGYHEGAWPSGGYEAPWGESSQWYLAGLGGQECDRGYFFHWLLDAGGYSTPADVKHSFSNGNAEVIIWNWTAAQITQEVLDQFSNFDEPLESYITEAYISSRLEYASSLFHVFQAYVETNLWGLNGSRRPVAWGSAMASHSRAITGSDGENLFFNNPSVGSWNDTKSWETYRQEVLDSLALDADVVEIIDTVIFYAEPRPASERRGVLWLMQRSSDRDGSIILRRGEERTPVAYWLWNGAYGHDFGYYYEDVVGDLPADPKLGVQFQAMTPKDVIEFGYAVRGIAEGVYTFEVKIELFSETGKVQAVDLPIAHVSAAGWSLAAPLLPAGEVEIGDLAPGLYHLKFTLSLDGVVQDVKYVFFRLAERAYTLEIPKAELLKNALCRKGPGTAYGVVTGFEAPMELEVVGVNAERTWGYFQAVLNANKIRCWISLDLVEMYPAPDVPIIGAPPLEPTPVTSPCAQYTTPQACAEHGDICTWNRLVSPAVCQAK